MEESRRPGPGRSTAEAAVSERKKEIARRNEVGSAPLNVLPELLINTERPARVHMTLPG
jgi:hypothetical protein